MSLPVFFVFFLTNSLCRAVFSPNMLILVAERNATRCSRDILAAGDLKIGARSRKNVSCIPVGASLQSAHVQINKNSRR